MQFASKTPEQAGFEPRPYRFYFSGISLAAREMEGWENSHAHAYYDPANQWYGLQHNEPNKLLLAARRALQDGPECLEAFMEGFLEHPNTEHPEIAHAQKVLIRLANLK